MPATGDERAGCPWSGCAAVPPQPRGPYHAPGPGVSGVPTSARSRAPPHAVAGAEQPPQDPCDRHQTQSKGRVRSEGGTCSSRGRTPAKEQGSRRACHRLAVPRPHVCATARSSSLVGGCYGPQIARGGSGREFRKIEGWARTARPEPLHRSLRPVSPAERGVRASPSDARVSCGCNRARLRQLEAFCQLQQLLLVLSDALFTGELILIHIFKQEGWAETRPAGASKQDANPKVRSTLAPRTCAKPHYATRPRQHARNYVRVSTRGQLAACTLEGRKDYGVAKSHLSASLQSFHFI